VGEHPDSPLLGILEHDPYRPTFRTLKFTFLDAYARMMSGNAQFRVVLTM
jgi:hypothetical protein